MPEAPEIDTEKLHETIHEQVEREGSRLLRGIALTTALLAALPAIAALRAGATVNEALVLKTEAARLQSEASNQWAYYQAKGVKAAVQEASRTACWRTARRRPARMRRIPSATPRKGGIQKEARRKRRSATRSRRRPTTCCTGTTGLRQRRALSGVDRARRRGGADPEPVIWLGIARVGLAGTAFFVVTTPGLNEELMAAPTIGAWPSLPLPNGRQLTTRFTCGCRSWARPGWPSRPTKPLVARPAVRERARAERRQPCPTAPAPRGGVRLHRPPAGRGDQRRGDPRDGAPSADGRGLLPRVHGRPRRSRDHREAVAGARRDRECHPFLEDRNHAAYDADHAQRFFGCCCRRQDHQRFQGRFLGKTSPVHVFWGASISRARASTGGGRPSMTPRNGGCSASRIRTRRSAWGSVLAAGRWPSQPFYPTRARAAGLASAAIRTGRLLQPRPRRLHPPVRSRALGTVTG